MAYDATKPVASNNWSADVTAIKDNFVSLRQFFMTGVIPITGATIAYGYTGDLCDAVTFGGTIAGSAVFNYNASDELTSEVWTIYSATITITHTWTSGKLTSSAIAIT